MKGHFYHANSGGYAGLAVFDTSGANRKDLLLYQNGSITWNTNTVWHAGNDGSGSGLDADLLDGQQFLLFDAANSGTISDVRITDIGDSQARIITFDNLERVISLQMDNLDLILHRDY